MKMPHTIKHLANPAHILDQWQFFQKIPFGNRIFSSLIGWLIPYTGSIKPLIKSIKPGSADVILRDRRSIRNHLKSIHAIALANVGEFTSGLALFSNAPKNVIAIITKLEVNYLKKARGNLLARASFSNANYENNSEHIILTTIQDAGGETVATVHASWRIRTIT